MKKIGLVLTLVHVIVLMLSGQAAAQSGVDITAWSEFTVTGSDVMILEFERDPGAGNTSFVVVSPAPGAAAFPVMEKDGAACQPRDASGCAGSFVDPPPTSPGTFQIIGFSEAPTRSWFRVRAESGNVGGWTVERPATVAFANANFGFVHIRPEVAVAFPTSVSSGQSGVTLDASASRAVFLGTPQPPTPVPALSYTWTQLSGPAVTITPSADGETATFRAPLVTANTNVRIRLTINDGVLEASETITITVTPPSLSSISISPTSASVRAGSAVQLTANGSFSDGTSRTLGSADGLTWRSSNTSVATVNSAGRVTGARVGSATITAAAGSRSATREVTVTAPPPPTLSSISITPSSPTVEAGTSIQLTATGTFSDGSSRTLGSGDGLTWRSSDTSVATVTSGGMVRGASGVNDRATITARASSRQAQVTVVVFVLNEPEPPPGGDPL